MILRTTFMQRRDGMTPQEYLAHWRNVHVPLATKLEGLALYHLNAVQPGGEAPEALPLWPIDGIAQLGFADMAAMKKAGSTAAGSQDLPKFVKILPVDYRRALQEIQAQQAASSNSVGGQ